MAVRAGIPPHLRTKGDQKPAKSTGKSDSFEKTGELSGHDFGNPGVRMVGGDNSQPIERPRNVLKTRGLEPITPLPHQVDAVHLVGGVEIVVLGGGN